MARPLKQLCRPLVALRHARAALLLALLRGACGGDVLLSPFVDSSWDVKVLAYSTPLEVLGLTGAERSFPMTNADGVEHVCYAGPNAVDLSEPSTLPINTLEARATAATALIEKSGCVLKTIDFWTYEVCPGARVRQFHKEIVPIQTPPSEGAYSGPGSPVTTADLLLGEYARAGETVVSRDGALVLTHRYVDGYEGRSAQVVYDCDAGHAAVMKPGGTSGPVYELMSITEPSLKQYVLTIAARDTVMCALLPSPLRLLAPLNATCIEHVEGWWTYELCLGSRLRQYHRDEAGAIVQESIIGNFDGEYGQRLEHAVAGTNAALGQRYGGGSACDIRKGKPREASVRFECSTGTAGSTSISAGSGHRVVSVTWLAIRESPTCEYTVHLSTPLACAHPDAMEVQNVVAQEPPRLVLCIPEGVEEEGAAAASSSGAEAVLSDPSAG
jgi:hypothetical protein